MTLAKLIEIDEEKCVNCHRCISVCPVKYSNDGSGDTVKINEDLCIGCGQCIKACTHEARLPVDDFDKAMGDLQQGEKIIAIVAPAIAASYPHNYHKINGFFKSLGVKAFFDVSFGAELTVKSYLEYIQKEKPRTVIAQPCPAIVSYIQIYQPELIPYLAPADSPMLHVMKMVSNFYPQYKDHKMLVISPCIAKKREFEETGTGDYNVTMNSIDRYLKENKIDLSTFPEVEFANDPAERAVLFSSPGGLLETAEREVPGIRYQTRKIEGPEVIYDYLKKLPEQIEKGNSPLLIDCLNCELGCNGGTGTLNHEKSPDELESLIKKRKNEMQAIHKTDKQNGEAHKALQKLIEEYWQEGLYDRKYKDLSHLYIKNVKPLSSQQLLEVYESLHKYEDSDIKNCPSCGYDFCENMAVAIHNNLNKQENCHFYIQRENEGLHEDLQKKLADVEESEDKLTVQKKEIIDQAEHFLVVLQKLKKYTE
jgi:iron only hydrogenase large subunit-like protein